MAMTKEQIAVTKAVHQLVAMAVCSPPNSRMGEWSVLCLRYLETGPAFSFIASAGINRLQECQVRTDYSNS